MVGEVVAGRLTVPGVGVGTVTRASGTGVTVVTLPPGTRGSAAILGGAPATRDTELLRPENMVPGPDAVFLTGGSAFGLRVGDGVMAALAAAGRGFPVAGTRVPIVVGAALFDLGDPPDPPTAEDGRQAAEEALSGGLGEEGRRGAGAGATVGKVLGPARAMAGGQAMVTLAGPDGLAVGALVAVNALGSVVDADGSVLAGPVGPAGPLETLSVFRAPPDGELLHTTLAVVATNARLHKAELRRVALMAHDGFARAIEPVHTRWDGDAVFSVATQDRPADPDLVGALAARAVALAIRRAVTLANA
jgi:L-aminopeptidase/D-esterase-like protein